MKKRLLFLILFLFVLTGCENETEEPITCDPGFHLEGDSCVQDEEEPIEIVCTENQIKQDNECVDLTGSEIALRDSFFNVENLTNFRLATSIENETITTWFDDELRSIETSNNYTLYKIEDAGCFRQNYYLEVSKTEEIDCFDTSNSEFYRNLDYSWFSLTQGKYVLIDEYLPTVESYLSTFDEWDLLSLKLSILDGYIYDMELIYFNGIENVVISMVLDEIDNVDLTWEEVS